MNNKILPAFVALALAVSSCAQSRKAVTGNGSSGHSTMADGHGYNSVRFARTGCYGRCPAYSITISTDGKAVYEGKKFAPYMGVYEKSISISKTQQLFDSFYKYRIDTCISQYPMRIADVPGTIFEIDNKGKKQTILNANFGPAFLNRLGKLMDTELAVDNSWKKTSEDTDK